MEYDNHTLQPSLLDSPRALLVASRDTFNAPHMSIMFPAIQITCEMDPAPAKRRSKVAALI
jgi:hypothetical protein